MMTEGFEFRILGGLEVVHAGGPLEIGAAKERSLLAQLVLRANNTVSRDRLIDVAWGENPPATARTTLNTYVCHLRAAFDGAAPGWGQVLVTRTSGYALAIENDQVDAARFERMVDEGRWALAAGDATAAASTLTRALQFALIGWGQGQADSVNAALHGSGGGIPSIPAFRAGLALNLWELGREEEAAELYRSLVDAVLDLPVDRGWYAVVTMLGEVCASLGDTPRAPVLYRLLTPYGDRVALFGTGQGCLGSVWRVLAMLATTEGDWARAEDHFERALVVNRRLGARGFLVRTQRAYAQMLLARDGQGDAQRGTALAKEALQAAGALGMALEERHLCSLLDSVEVSRRD